MSDNGTGLERFLSRHGDDAAELLWTAALSWLEAAARDAGEAHYGRWRYYPAGELRRLRTGIARALELARLAVAMQEQANEEARSLAAALRDEAANAAARGRRRPTAEATRVRLLKQAAAREGLELEFSFEHGWRLREGNGDAPV
jgi:hypothetical protein